MPEESRTITIARPVGEVFAFLADAENDKMWRHGVIEITRTRGQGDGTTDRQVVSGPGGRRVDADVEITQFVPDQWIAFSTIKGPARPSGSYDMRTINRRWHRPGRSVWRSLRLVPSTSPTRARAAAAIPGSGFTLTAA
jgi:uncharacterized protein YndB with AHSA1/START domain